LVKVLVSLKKERMKLRKSWIIKKINSSKI
jgi:hypothetical protein